MAGKEIVCNFADETPKKKFINLNQSNMEKKYKTPTVVWLKMTDYMHGWIEHELGGTARVQDRCVICVHHLPGARGILRMETFDDLMDKMPVGNALSDTRMQCYMAGLNLDENVMREKYGATRELMALFMPIECPEMRLTKNGVLRPWTMDACLGKEQASALQRLLRETFWDAVTQFDKRYSESLGGAKYPAKEMVEEFCYATNTPEEYVDAIRREWQRRVKRGSKD